SQSPLFTSSAPPNGALNTAYSFTVIATGVPAPVFSVSNGSLPTGLALNATSGIINGTPSASGTFSGVTTAANGVSPNATQTFAITISAAPQPPLFTSSAPANGIVNTGYSF